MRLKKIIAGVLAAMMCLSPVSAMAAEPTSAGATDVPTQFHYEQLDDTAKQVYAGIYAMYENGLLKTGTQDYDLAANGHFSKEQIAEYAKNRSKLTSAMNAARYAFYADYPEVFYVNFPKLTLRTTKGSDGTIHIYLGSGRYENYYIDGFSSESDVDLAIQAFDQRVDEIVAGARELESDGGKNLQKKQIQYVHNEIIRNTSYRLEDACFDGDDENPSNASFLGTPYGVLVKKQGVCEGYSRAFKAIMDKLGIACILVQGVHQYDGEVAVAHMWNYVNLDDHWYAVDLTQDDPERLFASEREYTDYRQHFDTYGNDGFENEKYMLAGQTTMDERHFVNEDIDAAGGYHFDYPSLERDDFGTKEAVNTMDGFLVKQKTVSSSNGDETEFQISYRGMNMTKAKENGIYLLARYYDYGEGDESDLIVPLTGWCYFSDSYAFTEDDTSIYLREGNAMYLEFAATTVAPREGLAGLTYAGDDYGLIARTGKIQNENQNGYMAPPFVLRQTPTQTSMIEPGNTPYHAKVVYDEPLAMEDGADEIGYRIICRSGLGNAVTGAEYTKITNVTWDGDRTLEFDIAFSHMYADDSVSYEIYMTGLVGKNSHKTPNPAHFGVRTMAKSPCVMNRNGSWDVFGKPTLLENEDLSVDGWTMPNGKEVSEKLKDRIALVTTDTTAKQETQMDAALEEEFPGISDSIVSSSTYNITLTVCKNVVIQTGHKVKVRVGFPEGCGPDDEGITYKAYHFKHDTDGNVTGVEEIDCVVTPYGLILTCDAFSPFAVAAVQNEGNIPETKSIVATASDGGMLTGADLDQSGILKLSSGESKTIQVKAHDGYEIDSITVCGKVIDISNKEQMEISVSYDMLQTTNNIVHADFVAKTVIQKETDRNELPTEPIVIPATVTLPETITASKNLVITPEISETSGVHSYQWYKNGTKLEGKTNKEFILDPVTESDAGSYQLQVITTVNTISADTMSEPCIVTVISDCNHEHTTTHPAESSTCTVQGHEEYVTCDTCHIVVSGSDAKLPLVPHALIEKIDDAYLKSEATCDTKAVYFKSCSVCGEKSEETFETGDVTEHDLEKVEAKEATHEEDGNIEHYKCSICGRVFEDEKAEKELTVDDITITKGEHVYGDTYQFDAKNHWKECDCGNRIDEGVHNFMNNVDEKYLKTEAVDGQNAIYFKSCSVCGAKSEETFEYDESDDHTDTIILNDKPATCTEDGYTGDLFCNKCGLKIADGTVIPATGHILKKVDAKDATHEEDGNCEYYLCTSCNRIFADPNPSKELTLEETVIPKGEHSYPDTYKTDEENHWKECDCGNIIDKAVHKFSDWTVVTEATTEKTGSKERVCSICGYKEMEEIPMISDSDETKDPSDSKDPSAPNDPSKPNEPSTDHPNDSTQTPNTSNDNNTPTTGDQTNKTVTTNTGSPNTNPVNTPKTGDNSSVMVWGMLALLSVAAIGTVFVVSRKKRK